MDDSSDKWVDFSSLFKLGGGPEGSEPKKYGFGDVKVSVIVPQAEKILFEDWDRTLRRNIMRNIPEGTVFKVLSRSWGGDNIIARNPNYGTIEFYKTEVIPTRVPVELKGMDDDMVEIGR